MSINKRKHQTDMIKNRLFTSIMTILLCSLAFARNTTSRLAQITSPVTLSADVDLVITNATTPFTETGSVNIANTEHAVIILENIRPSDALAFLPYIKINGEDAVNNETCQVKMYAHGSIILPYGFQATDRIFGTEFRGGIRQ